MKLKQLYYAMIKHKWELGFVTTPLKDIVGGGKSIEVNWVKHNYTDRWFADPFILSYDNENVVLLVEEFPYSTNRGRLAKLVVNRRTNSIVSNKLILDLETHLSFPAIKRVGEEIYVYPENYQSGQLALYKYDLQTDTLIDRTILCEEKLTDAVETDYFGRNLIFSTCEPNANGDTIGIYAWDDNMKKYKLESSVSFNENIARNAGAFFEFNGKIYRPAQECNRTYGHAISIQEVKETMDKKFSFREVNRIFSPSSKLGHGCHTFNVYGDLIAFDAHGFRHYYIASFIMAIRKLFK